MGNLDVKGAFDAAWWPVIKNYVSEMFAFISTNSMRIDTTISKGFPQESCCGPRYGNVQYNSLLNRKFAKWTRAIALVDDLLIVVKAATVAEAENFTNIEMSKITKWSKENKLHFND